jgi:hypothetical protein
MNFFKVFVVVVARFLFRNCHCKFLTMAERAGRKKKRAVRQNSNVFAMFEQSQIAEFKEAFTMIDHDSDGFIDKEDLKDMLASLGKAPAMLFQPLIC